MVREESFLMFVINNKPYSMHKCFVDYDLYEPLFFSVKAEDGSLYIVECIDEDNYTYYACETTEDEIFQMLDKQITMRDMFLNKHDMYEINQDETRRTSGFDPELLPFENKYYEIFLSDIRNYYEILKKQRYLMEKKVYICQKKNSAIE